MLRILICLFISLSSSLFGDLSYPLNNGDILKISKVEDPAEIPYTSGENVLVRSFMTAYEDVPLLDLNPEFKSTGDVRRFYKLYFQEEFHHFSEGKLIWFQAFINEELVGFATFEFESAKTAYMNLLAVDPSHQMKSIGKHLVFSVLNYYPQVKEISLLIRKVNIEGMKFYNKLGFVFFNTPRDDNFVDMSLLEGMHYTVE